MCEFVKEFFTNFVHEFMYKIRKFVPIRKNFYTKNWLCYERPVLHRSSNKIVMRIWNKNVMIKKVYECSTISRFKYQSLKRRNKMELK